MAEGTKAKILKVATLLFEKYGYEKTSVDDIAKMSHCAKGSIYYNFLGKLDILKAIVSDEFSRIESGLTAIIENTSYKSDKKDQIFNYLMKRMELFNQATVYKQLIKNGCMDYNTDEYAFLSDLRRDFDAIERNYFVRTCEEGLDCGILSTDVQPDAFADMLQMVLKSLETHFFANGFYEVSKPSFEYMVALLIGNSTKNKQ